MSQPTPSPFLYRASLATVAVTMAVLPVVYVALMALALWGVYLFATHYFLSIWAVPGVGQAAFFVKILLSCTPLLVGGTAAFFMVKPLFARRRVRTQSLVLTACDEPLVHALVDEVCRLVGARSPRRIELSCIVNASARNGRVFSDASARELFGNFGGLSRLVTLAHYENHFNVPVTPDFLIPLEKVIEAEATKPAEITPPARRRKSGPIIGYEPGKF